MPTYKFRRSTVGHFFVGASSTTCYGNQGDVWAITLTNGITSTLGKFIDSAPDVTSTSASVTIPNVSEFTALFDQYRISNVHFKLVPMYSTNVEGTGSTPGGSASMFYCFDMNTSGGSVSTLATLLQREGVRIERLADPGIIEFDIKPNVLLDADNAGAATGGSLIKQPVWLSCASQDLANHSSVKLWFDTGNTVTGTDQLVIMFVTFDLEFRNVV